MPQLDNSIIDGEQLIFLFFLITGWSSSIDSFVEYCSEDKILNIFLISFKNNFKSLH